MSCLPCLRSSPANSQQVNLNVGGHMFCTSRSTLLSYKGTIFEELLAQRPGPDNTFFVDRDASRFRYVLNFLRDGPDALDLDESTTLLQELRSEARYFKLQALTDIIDSKKQGCSVGCNSQNLRASLANFHAAAQGRQVSGHDEYQGADIPKNEELRLERLRNLDIMGTSSEHRYDALTRAVAAVLDVPICLISLVADDQQWFKSRVGLDAESTSRKSSFCAFMLKPENPTQAHMLVIEDTHRDPHVADNPLVTGEPFIRFYAGSPIVLSDGLRMGALCAIDRRPRSLTATQSQILVNFAGIVAQEMEKNQLRDLDIRENSMCEEEGTLDTDDFAAGALRKDRMRQALEEAILLVWARWDSLDWPIVYANDNWSALTGAVFIPPSRLPHAVEVKSKALPQGKNPGMLWSWLRLANPSSEYVSLLWRQVRGISATDDTVTTGKGTSTPQAFTVPTVLSSNNKKISCRFTPAELPLDVTAATIRTMHADGPAIGGSEFVDGWGPGRFVFVTAMATGGNAEPSTEVPPSSASKFTSDGSVGSSTGGRKKRGNDIEALGAIKPPKQPFDDVRLLKKVGEGSFGKVFFGLWSGAGVAVKVIETPVVGGLGNFSPPFEAALAASISHPNLVQTYKSSTREKPVENSDGVESDAIETWIVQEWCELGTLDQRCAMDGEALKESGAKALTRAQLLEALEVAMEVAEAGSYLHSRGIIHGDLTANNVLLKNSFARKGYICKVCDFGLARILEGGQTEVITKSLGTVTHMPPELFGVASGGATLTPKADVYSLGIILWQVVTKSKPFSGQSAPQVVIKVAKGHRPVFPKGMPTQLQEVYKACVEAKVDSRHDFDSAKRDLAVIHKEEQSTGTLEDLLPFE